MAGNLQLAREQVRLDRCCVRIIERLLPVHLEVLDLVQPSGAPGSADRRSGVDRARLVDSPAMAGS